VTFVVVSGVVMAGVIVAGVVVAFVFVVMRGCVGRVGNFEGIVGFDSVWGTQGLPSKLLASCVRAQVPAKIRFRAMPVLENEARPQIGWARE
jgi:hypothetical protein